MANGIDRETFKGYDSDSKLNTLFDYIHVIYEQSCKADEKLETSLKTQVDVCEKKFASQESMKHMVWAIRTIYAIPIVILLGYIFKSATG